VRIKLAQLEWTQSPPSPLAWARSRQQRSSRLCLLVPPHQAAGQHIDAPGQPAGCSAWLCHALAHSCCKWRQPAALTVAGGSADWVVCRPADAQTVADSQRGARKAPAPVTQQEPSLLLTSPRNATQRKVFNGGEKPSTQSRKSYRGCSCPAGAAAAFSAGFGQCKASLHTKMESSCTLPDQLLLCYSCV
jgi:hypothetical protein